MSRANELDILSHDEDFGLLTGYEQACTIIRELEARLAHIAEPEAAERDQAHASRWKPWPPPREPSRKVHARYSAGEPFCLEANYPNTSLENLEYRELTAEELAPTSKEVKP